MITLSAMKRWKNGLFKRTIIYHFDAANLYPTSSFKGHNIVDLDFVYKQLLGGLQACKTTLSLTQYQIERLIGLASILYLSLQNCSTATDGQNKHPRR